jgi:hypothetical protein
MPEQLIEHGEQLPKVLEQLRQHGEHLPKMLE